MMSLELKHRAPKVSLTAMPVLVWPSQAAFQIADALKL